jgi:hypothetical protein
MVILAQHAVTGKFDCGLAILGEPDPGVADLLQSVEPHRPT